MSLEGRRNRLVATVVLASTSSSVPPGFPPTSTRRIRLVRGAPGALHRVRKIAFLPPPVENAR